MTALPPRDLDDRDEASLAPQPDWDVLSVVSSGLPCGRLCREQRHVHPPEPVIILVDAFVEPVAHCADWVEHVDGESCMVRKRTTLTEAERPGVTACPYCFPRIPSGS